MEKEVVVEEDPMVVKSAEAEEEQEVEKQPPLHDAQPLDNK